MALGKNISPGQGETYYRKDDYFLKREGGDDHKLKWGGKLAPELGLVGEASAEDWKNALHGHFPGGIEIKGGSFKDPETGELLKRAGTDFVNEAPKTISMLYAATDNQDLKDWILSTHAEADALVFGYLESQIGARRGKDGKNWETTGEALYGRVTHFSNREGECFIHSHGVFLNVTKNSDGNFQAMTNDRMMHHQRVAQAIKDAHWAFRSTERGLEIEKGKYGELQLAGFTRDQIEAASGRARDIEQYIKDKWGLEWAKLPREERNEKRYMHDEAWERTRKAKKVHELEGLEEQWKEESKVIGYDRVVRSIEEKFEKGVTPKYLSPEKRLEIARESLAFALEHHTERESAVKEGELIRTALQDGRGKITMEDLKKAVAEAKDSGVLIRQPDDLAKSKQNLVTSRDALEREKRILSFEKEGRGVVAPVMNPLQAEKALKEIEAREGLRLNAEQKAAARMILTTDSRYVGINGFAGVGKTTMLKPSIEALKESGVKIIGLGPQHSAVHALKDAGIIESQTMQSWLVDRQAGRALNRNTVVVIDEAGIANAGDLESAMRRIEKAEARAVFVGDIKQNESVAAGPAFALLQKAGMETVYVTEMQRQRNAPENIREAAKASVTDPSRALELLEKNITEIRDPKERFRALAEAYLKAEDPRETLCLTGTHEARKAVNENVREALGLAGKGTEYTVFRTEDWSVAELRRAGTYEAGQEIRFGKDYRSLGMKAGEVATVREVHEGGGIRIETPDGTIRSFDTNRLSGKGWEIGKREAIELAKGDRIRITGNELKKEGITNGMRGEVLEAEKDRLTVRFDNGREMEIPVGKKPLEIDHGYAQTGHSAQGLGAQKVILDLPSGSQTLNQRSFYTNLTRTKGEVIAFTDDRERLTSAVTREKDKTMAHDVEKENTEQRREVAKERKDLVEERERGQKTMEQGKEVREEKESVTSNQKERDPEKDRKNDMTRNVHPEEKTMEREREKEKEKENRLANLTDRERNRLETWKEGQKLRFPSENKELGIKAGEEAQVEKMDRQTGQIDLKMQKDGRDVKLEPEYMKKEREKKALEIDPDRKTMEQKEQRKEENDASKEKNHPEKEKGQERPLEKDRSMERRERQQEKEREEKKEAPRRERERGRDGLGY